MRGREVGWDEGLRRKKCGELIDSVGISVGVMDVRRDGLVAFSVVCA